MDGLKLKYEALNQDIQSLKTQKKIFMQKLDNLRMKCELKKSKLDLIRKRQQTVQDEYQRTQERILKLRQNNNDLHDNISMAEELRYSLKEEIESRSHVRVIEDKLKTLIGKQAKKLVEL